MYDNLAALIDSYNDDFAKPQGLPLLSRSDAGTPGHPNQRVELPCTAHIIGTSTYGKIDTGHLWQDQVFMEYKHFYPFISNHLDSSSKLRNNTQFIQYVQSNGSSVIYELADYAVATLPSPREAFYKDSNYYTIQKGVLSHFNSLV